MPKVEIENAKLLIRALLVAEPDPEHVRAAREVIAGICKLAPQVPLVTPLDQMTPRSMAHLLMGYTYAAEQHYLRQEQIDKQVRCN